MGLPGARLRRGPGFLSSFKAGALKLNYASVLLDASQIIFAVDILSWLRHPPALAPKGIAHGIPRARSSACDILEIPAYSVLQLCHLQTSLPHYCGPRRRRRDNDARRPAHARRGPLAPALHAARAAPALPARIEALSAPVRAPPTRSRRRHPGVAVSLACTTVADEQRRPDGPGRLARRLRHGR